MRELAAERCDASDWRTLSFKSASEASRFELSKSGYAFTLVIDRRPCLLGASDGSRKGI